jgi:hypothetical protein
LGRGGKKGVENKVQKAPQKSIMTGLSSGLHFKFIWPVLNAGSSFDANECPPGIL